MIVYHGNTIGRELEGKTYPIESSSLSRKKKAFSKLESLRKKASYNLDYDEELASYREKKYGNENGDRGDYTAEKYKEAEDEVIEKLAIGRAQNENGEGIPFDEAMRRIGMENGMELSYGKPKYEKGLDIMSEELEEIYKAGQEAAVKRTLTNLALEMLADGFEPEVVSKYSKISIDEVKILARQ